MSFADYYNPITWAVFGLVSALNLAVLAAYRTEWGARHLARPAAALLRRLSGRNDFDWLDWVPVLAVTAAAYGSVVAFGILTGAYGCHPPGVSDPIGLLNSGRAFWSGGNPFTVPDCGSTIAVPYGLAAVLVDALGSLGGLPGLYTVWGVVALAFLPLVWSLGGSERREVLLVIGTSVLWIPLLSTQVDGVTNAIVPSTLVLSLYLARRSELLGAVAGGFLSTARFPNLFPILGASGSLHRRYAAFAAALGAFVAVTGVSFLVWHSDFLDPVFFSQIGRRSFSLNVYGVLLFANALPSSLAVEAVQAALTITLVLYAFFRVRSAVGAVALVLTGFALLTPFLSFDILLWLLPIALVGARARGWLWGIATVGAFNYDVALNLWAWDDGVTWPSAVLDVVLTILLLALLRELLRPEGAAAARGGSAGPPAPPAADG